MSDAIYKALWAFLYIISRVYDIIGSLIITIYYAFEYAKSLISNEDGVKEMQYLEECKKDLSKIPKHLSIIIGSEEVNPDILSKIAVYALTLDINYISYYDIKGNFSLDHSSIPKYIKSREMQTGRFLWSMPADKKKSGVLKYRNGLEKSIEVVVISSEDGKPLLADVCKELCATKNSLDIREALNNNDVLGSKITSVLQKRLDNLPDPELAIILDKTMCTYGFLPWNTSFTEFHRIDTANYFNVRSFANILYKFSKCEQRFGK